VKVRPGLSGIGSIVFRDEEDMMHGHQDPNRFYDEVIMPYKGRLEEWYVQNQNLYTYFMLIGLTVWVVLMPGSGAVWKVFGNLPKPDQELAVALGAA
jgi:lipopolysaccharide/colanic/teichoic acid biosynthesis glycosyltransferase